MKQSNKSCQMKRIMFLLILFIVNGAYSQKCVNKLETKEDMLYYYNDELYTGTFVNEWENGLVALKINIKDGKFDGDFEQYNKRGDTVSIKTYKAGKYHGINSKYYNNGKIKNRQYWENDIFIRFLSSYRRNGNLKFQYDSISGENNYFYSNGQCKFKNDLSNNSMIWYYKNGNKEVEWIFSCRDSLLTNSNNHIGIQYYKNGLKKVTYKYETKIVKSEEDGPFVFDKKGNKYSIKENQFMTINYKYYFKKGSKIDVSK